MNQITHNLTSAVVLGVALCSGACRPQGDEQDTSASAASQPAIQRPDSTACVVADSGIGPVRLGISLDEARRAFPAATFERATDGDGAALVEVKLAGEALLYIHAGEEDAEAPIDWSKKIERIETFSASCHTADGIRPGSLITDVEQHFGKTKRIFQSEIEARQYIEFERQPTWLTIRLDYTGVFSAGSPETTTLAPGAKVFSLAVTSYGR